MLNAIKDQYNILLLSDLHLEFEGFIPAQGNADFVVLAGDIHVKQKAIPWIKEHFNVPVLYIIGNHEYYKGSLNNSLQKLKAAAEGSNIRVLNNEVAEFGNIRFLGCTLWTDYRLTGNQVLAQWDAEQVMTDFKQIREADYRRLRASTIAQEHALSRRFLEDELEREFQGATVVITHHAPTELSIVEPYRSQKGHLNAAYASQLDRLMSADRVSHWFHGHTHASSDYDMYGTRVVCNPRGYSNADNKEFNPNLVIPISASRI
jgi:predicted phosphodiesterase